MKMVIYEFLNVNNRIRTATQYWGDGGWIGVWAWLVLTSYGLLKPNVFQCPLPQKYQGKITFVEKEHRFMLELNYRR